MSVFTIREARPSIDVISRLIGPRETLVFLAGMFRQKHPKRVNAQRRAKWRAQQRQNSQHQAQHPCPRLALKQSPSQNNVRDPKKRQQSTDGIESERQKIERPVSSVPWHAPAHQKRKHLSGDENRPDFREAQNSIRQPKTRQHLNVPLHPPIGSGSNCGRSGLRCRGRRNDRLPARTAELRTGADIRSAFIAKHGWFLPVYQDTPSAPRRFQRDPSCTPPT
jgi:hypothetical protein